MKNFKFNFDTSGLTAINVQPQEGREIVKKIFESISVFDHVTFLDGIKGGDAVPLLDFTPTLTAKGCGFNASGDVAVSDATINTTLIGQDVKLCLEDLNKSAFQRYLPAGAMNGLEEMSEKDALILFMVGKYGRAIRNLALVGNTSGSDPVDGLVTRILASTAATQVTATTITSANALAELYKIYEAMPTDIVMQPEARPVIFINAKWGKAAIVNSYNDNRFNGALTIDANGGFELPYTSVRVQIFQEIADNKAVAGAGAYMFVGTDLKSDILDGEGFRLWYSQDNLEIRSSLRVRLGTAIAFANQFVKYTV